MFRSRVIAVLISSRMVPLIRKWALMEKAYDKQLLRLLARRTYKLTTYKKYFWCYKQSL